MTLDPRAADSQIIDPKPSASSQHRTSRVLFGRLRARISASSDHERRCHVMDSPAAVPTASTVISTSTLRTSSSSSSSPLLTLPAELRNHIFGLAVTCPRTIVTFHLDSFQRDAYEEAIPPPLARVSRQLRAETLPLWYECNTLILHTEGSKGEDARAWLKHFAAHLVLLRNVELWVRYVTIARDRSGSQGLLAVRMSRHAGIDADWRVRDDWRWVTVVREPDTLEVDARYLTASLRRLLDVSRANSLSPEHLWTLMVELRTAYAKQKVDRTLRLIV